jgi:hypothetical protein
MEIPNSAFNFTGDQYISIAAQNTAGVRGYIYLLGGGDDKGYLFVTNNTTMRMRFIPYNSAHGGAISNDVIGYSPTVFTGSWERSSGTIYLGEGDNDYFNSQPQNAVSIPSAGVTLLGDGNPGGASWAGKVYGMVSYAKILEDRVHEDLKSIMNRKTGIHL